MSDPWTDDPATWPPPSAQRRAHWLIERELRERLLASSPGDRDAVTREAYNDLFRRVPWHVANEPPSDDEDAYEDYWFRLYRSATRPTDTLVDVGCGRGGLVRRFAPAVAEAIGIDASDEMASIARAGAPSNARFMVASAIEPPLPPRSADVVVSRQVMEHLHPDDAERHLRAVWRILRPGGRFLIETPSRLTGPWDVSRGFTDTATGFHLREYTVGELGRMMRSVGFDRVTSPLSPSRLRLRSRALDRATVPASVKGTLERALEPLPRRPRRALARAFVIAEVVVLGERRG